MMNGTLWVTICYIQCQKVWMNINENELKEYFKDESILEYNVSHDDVDFFISWDTLLFLCYLNGIKSFDGLADYDIFEIEGVHETYQDSWGVSNEYREEIDKEFMTLMDNLIDNYSQEYKENLDNYKKIIRDLGFTKRYHSGTFEKKTDKKHIYIDKV